MDRTTARRLMLATPLTEEEVESYLVSYGPDTWPAIIEWADSPPAMDACDDIEADHHHA